MEPEESDFPQTLASLKKGDDVPSPCPTSIPDRPPKDCDVEKIKRGQKFFQTNVSCCIFGMLCSLICGLSVQNLLEALVFTRQSDTPQKALHRYIQTLVHVIRWHVHDLWESDSPARISLNEVRQIHKHVAEEMSQKRKRNKVYLSQYDMSLVQCGFIGPLILYPRQFGIRCHSNDLDDFIYLWRYIVNHIGVDDQNNICYHGYGNAHALCRQIQDEVLLPAMRSPPKDFGLMAKAFTDGLNKLWVVKFLTPEAVESFVLGVMGQKRPAITSLSDELRIWCYKALVVACLYFPGFKGFINKLVMLFYRMVTKKHTK